MSETVLSLSVKPELLLKQYGSYYKAFSVPAPSCLSDVWTTPLRTAVVALKPRPPTVPLYTATAYYSSISYTKQHGLLSTYCQAIHSGSRLFVFCLFFVLHNARSCSYMQKLLYVAQGLSVGYRTLKLRTRRRKHDRAKLHFSFVLFDSLYSTRQQFLF